MLSTSLLLSVCLCQQVVDPGDANDRRDSVTTTRGKTVAGRVVTPFDPEEILILQGGKRVRVPAKQLASMHTVNDSLREFFERRDRMPLDNIEYQWLLVEWADAHQLPAMAELQALHVVLIDPTHEGARHRLDHKLTKKGEWLWPHNTRWVSHAKYQEIIQEWGTALRLDSLHWQVRTDAGVRRAIDSLFDLERLYLFWRDQFGERLNLQEVLKLMRVHIWRDVDAFPGWTEMRLPYYYPRPYQDTAYTFFVGNQGRAINLFRVGSEHILNRCLVVDGDPGSYKDRYCSWFELGMAQWVESQFVGPPGQANATGPYVDPARARLVLNKRRGKLPILLQRTVRDTYYAGVTSYVESDWAYAEMFVAFLMSDQSTDGTQSKLLRYAFEVLRNKHGGSRTFDKAFGAKIETLERPFAEWLEREANRPPDKSRR